MILLKELLQEIQTHYRYFCFTSEIYEKFINIGFTMLVINIYRIDNSMIIICLCTYDQGLLYVLCL